MAELDWNTVYYLPDGDAVAFTPKRVANVKGFVATFQLKEKTFFQVLQERLPAHLLRSAGGFGNARGEIQKTKFTSDGKRRVSDTPLQLEGSRYQLEDKRDDKS